VRSVEERSIVAHGPGGDNSAGCFGEMQVVDEPGRREPGGDDRPGGHIDVRDRLERGVVDATRIAEFVSPERASAAASESARNRQPA
jgi:hypothetical protein